MKQISNYILEKLHINKDYKIESTDIKEFKKYLEKYGYTIDISRDASASEQLNICEILPIESDEGYPCINIMDQGDTFTDEFNRFDSGLLIIYTDPSDSYEFDTDSFDEIKDDGYAYTEKNARLIAEELDTLK